MIRLFTFILSTLVLGIAAPAGANDDCPDPYDELDCNSVCYYSSGEVYCSGVQGHDTFILIEDNQGVTHIYGTRDGGLSAYDFCCNPADLGSITGAVTANIDTGGGNNTVCLQDSGVSGCVQTIVGVQTWPAAVNVTGGNGVDLVHTCPSGAYDDEVDTAEMGDTVYTYDGDDTIYGGDASDTLRGGDGADTIYGEGGDDYIYGEGDADTLLSGGAGEDVIWGQGGGDVVDGGDDNDEVHGGNGYDDLLGGDNEDYLVGDGGNDCMCGGGTGANDDGDEDTIDGNDATDSDDCYYVSGEDSITYCENPNDGASCPCG